MKKCLSLLFALMLIVLCAAAPQTARAANVPAAGKVSTGGYRLNVRERATTSSSIRKKLTDQSWITLIEKSGAWWRVKYGENAYGYCHEAYIVPRSASVHAVLQNGGATVKIYRGEGTNYEVKAVLQHGTAVAVLTKGDNWSTVLFDGTHKGYVQTALLRETLVVPVSLNVTRYAQTDPRWKTVAIGTNGGTIGTIGCTTTCLAMSETFLTGQTVTPAMMAKQLRYAPGGSLYWPTDYTVNFSNSEIYALVHAQLLAGKPVVFGAKKANGVQHWVVVTGCDGSGLSPAAFSIHDPASTARKTLAQFLAVYPTLYKVAWKT